MWSLIVARFRLWRGLVGGLVLLGSVDASAMNISGTIRYWDSRTQRANTTGSQLSTTTYQTNRPLANAYIVLLDQDGACVDKLPGCSENDDDLLYTSYTNSSGAYSMQAADGEDVYLRFAYQAMGPNQAFTSTGALLYSTSSVIQDAGGGITLNWNTTCPNDARNNTQGFCDNQTDVNSYFIMEEALSNLIATMDAVRLRAGQPATGQNGYWPDDPAGNCAGAAAGSSYNNSFCVDSGAENHIIGHEMGHNIQRAQMGGSISLSNGTCTSGGDWALQDPAEKCVTAEGYASFVSSTVWWDPNSTSPQYRGRNIEGDTNQGNAGILRKCVSELTTPHQRIGNAARFFWGLYDSTFVGTDDASGEDETLAFTQINAVWSAFPAGTGNGQASEAGANGRNIEDYVVKAVPLAVNVERDHNCLGAQTPNPP